MLSSGSIQPVHRPWYGAIRRRLDAVDLELLQAVVPAHSYIADFLLPGATYPARTMADQLEKLAGLPADRIGRDIEDAWRGEPATGEGAATGRGRRGRSRAARRGAVVVLDRRDGAVLVDMRAVLDGDVAFRAAALTRSGLREVLDHPQISVRDEEIRIDKRHSLAARTCPAPGSAGAVRVHLAECDLRGGLGRDCRVRPTPRAASAGSGGHRTRRPRTTTRSGRCSVAAGPPFTCLELPHSTTRTGTQARPEPAVDQPASVGAAQEWFGDLVASGRSVLYRRTALAGSIVEASGSSAAVG